MKDTAFLDLSDTTCAVRDADGRGWLGSDITTDQWLLKLDDGTAAELDSLAAYLDAHPLPLLQRSLTEFELPRCTRLMNSLRAKLDDGVGFAVLDRLPVDRYDFETVKTMYWLLGQMVGRPVAQKWNGEMLYDVQDKGTAWGYGVRGSRTNIELVFHTDNAFAQCVPDYVGLLCRQPARSGGISRFCSLYTIHERVRQESEQALQRLYQPMFFDRQKEHAPDAPPLTWAPWFSWSQEQLHTRANTQLVRKGYQLAGTDLDSELKDALTILDHVCEDPAIWFEAPLQAGQMQYLNNHETGHYRSAFTDHEAPEHKRHLVRLWHRNRGSTAYDGDEFR